MEELLYITRTGLKNSLQSFLNTLKSKLPFKWANTEVDSLETNSANNGEIAFGEYNDSTENTILSVGVGTVERRKNALEIQKDGNIYILLDNDNDGINDDKVNLQSMILSGGEADSLSSDEINNIINKK